MKNDARSQERYPSAMIIATYNVNSVRARLPRLLPWLESRRPDVLAMQETKVVDEDFPRADFEELGYSVAVFGQKTYNGVAIASRLPIGDVSRGLPGEGPEDAKRVIEATIDGIRVVNLYVPNGKSPGSEHFARKLDWFTRLKAHLDESLSPEDPVVVLGDMNVTPDDRDVYDPVALKEAIHCTTAEREALSKLKSFGLGDAFRMFTEEAGHYSWWDYRAGMFRRGLGLRIDLVLVTPPLAARCRAVTIDRDARKGEKPSDHAPVLGTFDAGPRV